MRHKAITLHPSVFFLQQDEQAICRCGSPSLDEACSVCEQLVCPDCAVFVDPASKLPTRPSLLMSKGAKSDFLAHRICLLGKDTRLFPCVYTKDVPLMVRIIKGGDTLGRSFTPVG